MKRVLMFAGPVHEIPPIKGAAVESWMDEVSKKIVKYHTHIISLSNEFYPIKEYKEGVFYHRIHFSRAYKRVFQKILGWDVLSYNKRVLRLIDKIQPDIIHIHNYFMSHEIINKIKKNYPDTKIIFHMHNISDKFKKFEFPKIDAFIGCSNYIVNWYKNVIHLKANLFQTVYNGVDIKKHKTNENIHNSLFPEKKKICYFGRISPEKGVDKFIDLAILMKESNDFVFLLFGEISKGGGRKTFYNELTEKIRKNNLNNIFFYDYIPPAKIHLAYQYADFIIVPSRFEEPFGMVALEALASKKVLISAKKGGLVEFLNSNNSFLIEDYKNFANKAKDIILSDANFKSITNQAYNDAIKFDWVNVAINLEKIYDELTGS